MKREAVYIAMQPEAENSYWAANISEGIRRAAKDAQLETVTVDLSGELPDIGGRCVLVAGNDTDWLDAALGRLAECGALPIVVNACMLPIQRYRYSGVVFGLEEMLERCLELISLDGRRKTALLGVNPSSVTDRVKADAFSCAAYPCEREINLRKRYGCNMPSASAFLRRRHTSRKSLHSRNGQLFCRSKPRSYEHNVRLQKDG